TAGLLMDELCEGDGPRWCATQRIRDERLQMFATEGHQHDLPDLRTGAPDGLELAHERMGRVDFVVPIGTDHQQVAQVGADHQIFEEIERRRVDPMQIVEEECQGMFRLSECANEAPEGDLEQPAGLRRRKVGSGRLLADDQLEFGYELNHESSVRPKRLAQRGAPAFQLRVTLAHKAPDQSLECLGDRSVGNIVLMLIELARGEKTA